MGLPEVMADEHFTHKDRLSWPEDERWELINGVAYNMCASPMRAHQGIAGDLFAQIHAFLKGKPCKVYIAPMDVFLPEDPSTPMADVDTVVEPDIIVVCDPAKLIDEGIWGPPDWVIEILSPSTSKKDMREKFDLYGKRCVRHYWIVDPGNKGIQVYEAGEDGRYGDARIIVDMGRKRIAAIASPLPGLDIDLEAVFAG
jgi:Uma2 family endonuclease